MGFIGEEIVWNLYIRAVPFGSMPRRPVRRPIPPSQRILGEKVMARLSPFKRVQDPRILRSVSKYVKYRKRARLARSVITSPFDFSKAENVALGNARKAQMIFHSSLFRMDVKRLPKAFKKSVKDEEAEQAKLAEPRTIDAQVKTPEHSVKS